MVDKIYDLIGGKQTVWAATESFYRRVLADESLGPFFKHSDKAHLVARQSMFRPRSLARVSGLVRLPIGTRLSGSPILLRAASQPNLSG